MLKGDVVYCITKEMNSFTYGKPYVILSDVDLNSSLIDIENDFGDRSLPSLYYREPKSKEIKYYFIPRYEWRIRFIKKLLKK